MLFLLDFFLSVARILKVEINSTSPAFVIFATLQSLWDLKCLHLSLFILVLLVELLTNFFLASSSAQDGTYTVRPTRTGIRTSVEADAGKPAPTWKRSASAGSGIGMEALAGAGCMPAPAWNPARTSREALHSAGVGSTRIGRCGQSGIALGRCGQAARTGKKKHCTWPVSLHRHGTLPEPAEKHCARPVRAGSPHRRGILP